MEKADLLCIQIRSSSEQTGSCILSRLPDKILIPEVNPVGPQKAPSTLVVADLAPSRSLEARIAATVREAQSLLA
jgi:hypothetical protein